MLNCTGKVSFLLILVSLVSLACGPGPTPADATPSGQGSPAAIAGETGAKWELEWERTVAEAGKEGKLMIYSSQAGTLMQALADGFKQRFGIQVEYLSARGEELTQRIQRENGAGLYLADVMLAGGTPLIISMKPLGILGKLEPLLFLPEVIDPAAWTTGGLPFMDKDRTGLAMVANYEQYVLRNTDQVREGEIASYKDLLNPRWKGKMVFNDPSVSGTANGFLTILATDIWGLEETKEFMRQFLKQEPAITRDRRLQGEWVARGKYALSVATHGETAVDFIRLGSPVAFVKVIEGGKIAPGGAGLGVAARPPHPNATRLFVNWLLSREGHATFIKAYGRPGARRDAPREGIPLELFAGPGDKIYKETEEYLQFTPEMMKIAAEIFAPLLK